MNNLTGYQEIEHTADWALHVWAPDLPALLAEAARGMYALSQTLLTPDFRVSREFELAYQDDESLLVDFLSELLFFGEDENLAFDGFQIELTATTCKFSVVGASIQKQSKEIKAVTFHDLAVQETENGLEVTIIFDV